MTEKEAEMNRRLKESFPDSSIVIQDTGGQDHFHLSITSSAFKNKSIVEQHKLVYKALGDLFDGPVHAVVIETHTP